MIKATVTYERILPNVHVEVLANYIAQTQCKNMVFETYLTLVKRYTYEIYSYQYEVKHISM